MNTINQEAALSEVFYMLRNLLVGDDEQTRIADNMDIIEPEVWPYIQWTIENLGYNAANTLYIQWIMSHQVPSITLSELKPQLIQWMQRFYVGDEPECTVYEMLRELHSTLSPMNGEKNTSLFWELIKETSDQ